MTWQVYPFPPRITAATTFDILNYSGNETSEIGDQGSDFAAHSNTNKMRRYVPSVASYGERAINFIPGGVYGDAHEVFHSHYMYYAYLTISHVVVKRWDMYTDTEEMVAWRFWDGATALDFTNTYRPIYLFDEDTVVTCSDDFYNRDPDADFWVLRMDFESGVASVIETDPTIQIWDCDVHMINHELHCVHGHTNPEYLKVVVYTDAGSPTTYTVITKANETFLNFSWHSPGYNYRSSRSYLDDRYVYIFIQSTRTSYGYYLYMVKYDTESHTATYKQIANYSWDVATNEMVMDYTYEKVYVRYSILFSYYRVVLPFDISTSTITELSTMSECMSPYMSNHEKAYWVAAEAPHNVYRMEDDVQVGSLPYSGTDVNWLYYCLCKTIDDLTGYVLFIDEQISERIVIYDMENEVEIDQFDRQDSSYTYVYCGYMYQNLIMVIDQTGYARILYQLP